MTLTPPPDTNAHELYAGVMTKRKALTPQQQPGDEMPPDRHHYHLPLGMPITQELPPHWM